MGRVDSHDRNNIRGDIVRTNFDGHTGSDGKSRGARDTGAHGDGLLVDGGHDVVFDDAVRIVDDNLAATQDATGSRWQQEAGHQAEAAQNHVNLSTGSITYYFRDMVKSGEIGRCIIVTRVSRPKSPKQFEKNELTHRTTD